MLRIGGATTIARQQDAVTAPVSGDALIRNLTY